MLGWHKGDMIAVPGEAKVMETLRGLNVQPGDYRFPYSNSTEEMTAPEFVEKMKQGPVGIMSIWPNGEINMGKMIGQWFVYSLVIAVLAAYVTGSTHGPGAPYLEVFRVSGAVTFCCYVVAHWQNWIWWGKGTRFTVTQLARRHHLRADHRCDVRLAVAALTQERERRSRGSRSSTLPLTARHPRPTAPTRRARALGGQHVAEPNAHAGAATEARVREVPVARCIHAHHDRLVEPISSVVVHAGWSARKQTTPMRRRRSERRMPACASTHSATSRGKPAVLANARRDAVAPERAKRHPRLERAKAAAELDAVVHVVDARRRSAPHRRADIPASARTPRAAAPGRRT